MDPLVKGYGFQFNSSPQQRVQAVADVVATILQNPTKTRVPQRALRLKKLRRIHVEIQGRYRQTISELIARI